MLAIQSDTANCLNTQKAVAFQRPGLFYSPGIQGPTNGSL